MCRSMWSHLIIIFALLGLAVSKLISFEDAVVKQPEYLTIPKYSGDDAVPHWSPGNGRSYIDLSKVKVSQDCNHAKGNCSPESVLDILVFQDKDSVTSWMEHWPDKNFCCTSEMVASNECHLSERGSLHVPYTLSGVYKIRVNVSSDKPIDLGMETHSVTRLEIKETGLYVIVLAVCQGESNGVLLNGVLDSLDPYGYLPADEFGDLPFYGSLALVHTLIGVIWAAVCYCYWADLMFLQLWISIVLGIGMLETIIYFAYYLNWNTLGVPSIALLTMALVLGVLKRMISRVLVLVIALGYGVVRPSLGSDTNKVVTIGVSYFVLSLIYTLYSSLPEASKKSVDDPDTDLMAIIVLLLMAIEATFYFWIFKSLANLMDSLAARRQAAKYQLYRGFQAALLFSLLLTCGMGIFAIAETTMGNPDKEWKDYWLNDGYWELAYFVVFTATAFLFAPFNNYQRYAYHAQLATDDEEEGGASEGMELEDATEAEVDVEYGGQLNDDEDPFSGKGALDVKQAVLKKA